MSIRAIHTVWCHSEQSGNGLLVMLALADNADDDGYTFPGHDLIARKARLSKSTVRRGLKALVAGDELSLLTSGTWGDTNRYLIHLDVLRAKPYLLTTRTPPPDVHSGVQPGVHHTGAQEEPSEENRQGENRQEKHMSGQPDDDGGGTVHLPGMEPEPKPEPESRPWHPAEDPDAHQEVWDHYVVTWNPAQKNLSPSRRKLIAKGLRELHDPDQPGYAVATAKVAITGLKIWRSTKPGDEGLSAIFTTRPGGSALGDQINFFVQQAGGEIDTLAGHSPVQRDKVMRRRIEVVEMLRTPDLLAAREQGQEALAWLREHAKEEPVIDGDKVVEWKPVAL